MKLSKETEKRREYYIGLNIGLKQKKGEEKKRIKENVRETGQEWEKKINRHQVIKTVKRGQGKWPIKKRIIKRWVTIQKRGEEQEKEIYNKILYMTLNQKVQPKRGLRMQLSGRIRGVNMARELVFKFKGYSARSMNEKIQYNYREIRTKWGTWGYKVHMS